MTNAVIMGLSNAKACVLRIISTGTCSSKISGKKNETYELIPIRKLTERAHPVPCISNIPSHPPCKRPRVILTVPSRRRTEPRLLPGQTPHGLPVRDDAQEPLEQVVERREPVHPRAPEVREGRVGHDDAAEGDDEGEEGRDEEGGEDLVGRHGRDELAEADVEELEEHKQHPDVARGEGVPREPGAPVPGVGFVSHRPLIVVFAFGGIDNSMAHQQQK